MKIIQLEFENLNSLKGRHVIDFKNGLLGQAGLFLISGPTGSGKSTILDAITLSLFNKVPRLNSVSVREINQKGSIVTHFAKQAKASLTYESNGIIYNSTWSIAKNRNDNWNDYHMEIYEDVNKQLFDLKKSEVPNKNEELIGLNYDQFLKSILLSQGEFAQFLHADSNTRGALLERLTGTELYRKIGELAYVKFREERDSIQLDVTQIENIPIVSESDLLHKKESLIELENKIVQTQKDQAQWQKQLNSINETLNSKRELAQIETALNQLDDKLKQLSIEFKKLEVHQKLQPLHAELSIFKGKSEELELLEKEHSNLTEQQGQFQTSIQKAVAKLSEHLKKEIDHEHFRNEVDHLQKTYDELSVKLNVLEEQGKSIRNQIQTQINGIDELNMKTSPEEALTIINEFTKTYEAKAKEIKSNNKAIDLEFEETKELRDRIQNQLNISIKIQKNRKSIVETDTKVGQIQDDLKSTEILLKSEQEDISNKKIELERLEDEFQEFQKKANLTDLRDALTEGEPCPLCGSEDHPYATHQFVFEEGKYSIQIRTLKQEVSNLEDKIKRNAIKMSNLNLTLEQVHKEKAQFETQIHELEQEGGFPNDWDDDLYKKRCDQLNHKLIELKQLMVMSTKIQAFNSIKPLYTELNNLRINYRNLFLERKKVYPGNDFDDFVLDLKAKFDEAHSGYKTNVKLLDSIVSKIEKDKIILDTSKVNLKKKLDEIGFNDSILNAFDLLLDEDTVKHIQLQRDEIWNERVKLNQQKSYFDGVLEKIKLIDSISNVKEEVVHQLEVFDVNMKQMNQEIGKLNQELITDQKNRDLKDQKEKKLTLRKSQFEKWSHLNALIGDAKGNRFANFAQDLTLKSLIFITNKNLKYLTDRYVLVSTSITEGLFVYDTYQGDTIRSISTLSGGETFIISLAMAISLSELASRNVKIESIFIDEGFGSLDAESLEQAMVALETFQSYQNKTIGIISHVDSLKERIQTQIRLHKNNRGHSTISVIAT